MRPFPLLLVMLALAPAAASARSWRGVEPGVTSQAQVIARFGEPTTRTTREGRLVLAYHGDAAPAGTRQAQFHLDAAGAVQEITVFLATPLDPETIEGTYGRPPRRTFVEATFRKVWLYPTEGVSVYFDQDGAAEAITFAAGKGRPAAPAGPAGSPDAAGSR